jgi:hypothetical protein
MSKEEYMELCSKRYDELQALNKIDNFYDYENEFATIMKALGKEVLQKQLSDVPADRRKKNSDTIWGNKHCKQPSVQ